MCGIAGIINFKGNKIKQSDIDSMLDVMKYRGPDDRDIFIKDNIGLGHLRLSIIDLTKGGHQPMFDKTEQKLIVYNGEIYNYLELKKELENLGHRFSTKSDTEVILASYNQWGEDCVKRFNGMWSFVIFNIKNKKIFASRDRFGVKPFFYYCDNRQFVFASEIKAILRVLPRNFREVNHSFLYKFLDKGIPFGNQETVFVGIKFLPPGHNLFLNDDGKIKIEKHWDFDLDKFRKKYDYKNPKETLKELLEDAIRLRMRSDVPVGVCLSGGIDSSIIVSVLSKKLGYKINTFSTIYRFSEYPDYSEEEYIKAVVRDCGTIPHYVYPRPDKFFEILDKIVWHHDEPVQMPGTYSHWHVMSLAKDKVIVLLDGQGADEIFAGYPYYLPYYLADLLKAGLFERFISERKRMLGETGVDYGWKDIARNFLPDGFFRIKYNLFPKKRRQDELLSDDFLKYKSELELKVPDRFKDYLSRELYRTFTTTNLPMLLNYEDRISMAFSLESRVPFLDYRIVEFGFGLSYKEKINGSNKTILREAFRDLLPQKINQRKDKRGFPTPTEHWFRKELKDKIWEIIDSPEFIRHNIFNKERVADYFKKHLTGENNERMLWRILTTESWLRQYFN